MKASVRIDWTDIVGINESYRLLTLFRSSHPMLGNIPPEDLCWTISWSEGFTLIDMSLDASTRANIRMAVVTGVSMTCGVAEDAVGPTCRIGGVPEVIRAALLAAETERAP